MITVRGVEGRDRDALSAVAHRCEQVGAVSASDSRYVDYISSHGRFVVATRADDIDGFGGVINRSGAEFLTDLFVDPSQRSEGLGSELLASLWNGTAPRVTCASQDPRALALYARFGAIPRWPLLYCEVAGTSNAHSGTDYAVHETSIGDAGWSLQLDEARTVTTSRGASAVILLSDSTIGVVRMQAPNSESLCGLIATLQGQAGNGGIVSFAIPGPHSATAALLREGARIVDVDLWCSTVAGVDFLNPERDLPSPALG